VVTERDPQPRPGAVTIYGNSHFCAFETFIPIDELCDPDSEVGNSIKPNVTWAGKSRDIEFTITGRSDAEYASDPETRRSVSGGTVFLCGTVIHAFSRMQKCVTLSVTEAELVAAVEDAQNVCFARLVFLGSPVFAHGGNRELSQHLGISSFGFVVAIEVVVP
jgi:hypothetical protein